MKPCICEEADNDVLQVITTTVRKHHNMLISHVR